MSRSVLEVCKEVAKVYRTQVAALFHVRRIWRQDGETPLPCCNIWTWTGGCPSDRESLELGVRDYIRTDERTCRLCGKVHSEEVYVGKVLTGWSCERVLDYEQKARTWECYVKASIRAPILDWTFWCPWRKRLGETSGTHYERCDTAVWKVTTDRSLREEYTQLEGIIAEAVRGIEGSAWSGNSELPFYDEVIKQTCALERPSRGAS